MERPELEEKAQQLQQAFQVNKFIYIYIYSCMCIVYACAMHRFTHAHTHPYMKTNTTKRYKLQLVALEDDLLTRLANAPDDILSGACVYVYM